MSLVLDPCDANPCQNGGTCEEDFTMTRNKGDFICVCPQNCSGSKCEKCDGPGEYLLLFQQVFKATSYVTKLT